MKSQVIFKLKFILCFIGMWMLLKPLYAQNHSIKGILKDGMNEGYLEGAIITIKETAFSAVSNGTGFFLIENVYESKFVLNIQYPGYQSYQTQVNVNDDINLGSITLFQLGLEENAGEALQKTIRATNIAELFSKRPNFIGGNAVYGIPPEPKRLVGNFYLDPKWNKASILLYKENEIIEGYFVRYNINSNNFELRSEESPDAIVIPGLRVRNIVWIDSKHTVPRYFVNGMDFKQDGVPISGFFEVLVDGKIPLVRRTIASIKESNYNSALMVGNRNDEIKKRFEYYYIQDKNIFTMPKNKKQFFKIFGEMGPEMELFVTENNLVIRQASNLFSIFTQYNSQFEGFDPILKDLIEN